MMKLAQRKIRWLARLMLGLTLFTQGVIAANACIAPDASPVQAYAMVHDDEAAPCHDTEIPSTNACLAHCDQAGQISLDHYSVTAAAPAHVATWVVPVPQMQHDRQVIALEQVVPDTGPPIPIRFCSLLN